MPDVAEAASDGFKDMRMRALVAFEERRCERAATFERRARRATGARRLRLQSRAQSARRSCRSARRELRVRKWLRDGIRITGLKVLRETPAVPKAELPNRLRKPQRYPGGAVISEWHLARLNGNERIYVAADPRFTFVCTATWDPATGYDGLEGEGCVGTPEAIGVRRLHGVDPRGRWLGRGDVHGATITTHSWGNSLRGTCASAAIVVDQIAQARLIKGGEVLETVPVENNVALTANPTPYSLLEVLDADSHPWGTGGYRCRFGPHPVS